MRFSLKQAVSSITGTLFTTVFLILTFMGGYLVVFAATGFADAFFTDMKCYMYGSGNDYYAWINTTSQFAGVASESDGYMLAGGYYCSDGGSDGYYVSAVQSGYENEFHNKLLAGRYFSEEEYSGKKKACMVEASLADGMGYSVGDTCSVMGVELEIIGIVKTNAWLGRYIVPISLVLKIPYSRSYLVNYEMIVKKPSSEFSITALLDELTDSRYQISKSGRSSDVYRDMVISSVGRATAVILVSMLILIYALINLVNITEFRRDAKSKEIGIRLALGADMKQIYRETFLEYLLLMLTSIVLLFAMSPMIVFALKGWISWRLGAVSLTGLPLLAIIFSAIISGIVTKPFRKYNGPIIDIITERWRAE